MFNLVYITKEDIKEHNPNWPDISDHPYGILIVGDYGSGKIYLYAKDPNEAIHRLLINRRESESLKYFNDSKVFTEYSNDMDQIYKKY